MVYTTNVSMGDGGFITGSSGGDIFLIVMIILIMFTFVLAHLFPRIKLPKIYKCQKCGKYSRKFEKLTDSFMNSTYICKDCYHFGDYNLCEVCFCATKSKNIKNFKDNFSLRKVQICPNCFKEKVTKCFSCDKPILRGEYGSNRFGSAINDEGKRIAKYYCKKCYSKVYRRFEVIKLPFEKLESPTFDKNPFKRFAGTEIECLAKNRDTDCFINDELKNLKFSQVTDGSLSSGGIEFNSLPANGDKLLEIHKKFVNKLNEKDYRVDGSCGFHIHLEQGGEEKQLEMLKKIYLFYSKFEKYFFSMLPKSRQESSFCQSLEDVYYLKHKDILKAKTMLDFKNLIYERGSVSERQRDKYDNKRYAWINFHSVFFRGTLEVRAHSGTLNIEKIKNWLLIHLAILDFLENSSLRKVFLMDNKNPNHFLSLFPPNIRKYIKFRWSVFPKKSEREVVENDKINKQSLKELRSIKLTQSQKNSKPRLSSLSEKDYSFYAKNDGSEKENQLTNL